MDINSELRVISINSMHFNNKNKDTNDPNAPQEILEWLEEKLEQTQKQGMKAILMHHIPQGTFISPYGTEHFWIEKYEQVYKGFLKKFAGIISIIITGHTHISFLDQITESATEKQIDEMIDFKQNEATIHYSNLIVNRAASPLMQNAPGFTFLYFNNTLDYPSYLQEYTHLTLDSYNKTDDPLKYWIYLYSSHIDLGMADLSAKGIDDFLTNISKDIVKFLKYMLYKLGDRPKSTQTDSRIVGKIIRGLCKKFTEDEASFVMCKDSLLASLK